MLNAVPRPTPSDVSRLKHRSVLKPRPSVVPKLKLSVANRLKLKSVLKPRPNDVLKLRKLLRERGSNAMVIAKIEKREALDRLDEIVQAADAIMVARGDLGVEIDVAQMPVEQKRIIRVCQRYQRPVIIAGNGVRTIVAVPATPTT